MLKDLTAKQKQQIKCEVRLSFAYENNVDTNQRYECLQELLSAKGLESYITIGESAWSKDALLFECEGEISLASAEEICDLQNKYLLPVTLWYHQGTFKLSYN